MRTQYGNAPTRLRHSRKWGEVRWLPLSLIFIPAAAFSQDRIYVTGLGGFAILSGAAQTDFSSSVRSSSYRPEIGPAFNVGAGYHLNNWVSVQGNYVWNENIVFLSGTQDTGFIEARNSSRQQQIIADGLVYFRPRSSQIRPYLSFGLGGVHASRTLDSITAIRPPIDSPSPSAANWYLGIRIAVGIDLIWKRGWGFRYSFSETVTPNLFGQSLRPPAAPRLMNFQNLFGFVKYF